MPIRVILADALEPRINQIRAICEDWARAGLIRESIWIDIKSEIYQVMEMSAEGRRDIAAAEWLAGLPAGRDIQLVVLQPLLQGQEPIELEYIMRKLAPYTLLAQATGLSFHRVHQCQSSSSSSKQVEHNCNSDRLSSPRSCGSCNIRALNNGLFTRSRSTLFSCWPMGWSSGSEARRCWGHEKYPTAENVR